MPTLYSRSASSLKVGEIADAVPQVSTGEDLEEVMLTIQMHGSWFCVVKSGRRHLGFVSMGDEVFMGVSPGERLTEEHVEPFRPEQIVSWSDAVFDIVPLLVHEYYLFVKTLNEVTHVLSYDCLDKNEYKYALFGLAMEIEQRITDTIRGSAEETEERLALLDEGKQKRARKAAEKLGAKADANLVLTFTDLADKCTMMVRDPALFAQLPFASESEAIGFFNEIRDLRNTVAHGRSLRSKLGDLSRFATTVAQIQKLADHLGGCGKE